MTLLRPADRLTLYLRASLLDKAQVMVGLKMETDELPTSSLRKCHSITDVHIPICIFGNACNTFSILHAFTI